MQLIRKLLSLFFLVYFSTYSSGATNFLKYVNEIEEFPHIKINDRFINLIDLEIPRLEFISIGVVKSITQVPSSIEGGILKEKEIKYRKDRFISNGLFEVTNNLNSFNVVHELSPQEKELKRQKNIQKILLLGAAVLIVFIGVLWNLYHKLKKKNQLITLQKEDLKIANNTKDYLFAVVSHDLRSPMNAIKKQHLILKSCIESNDLAGIKQANDKAIFVTDSTSHLLNNILHWSLEQSNQLMFSAKEYSLKPLIKHVLHDYLVFIEMRQVKIVTELDNVLVYIDKESIKIVLRNLLDNSLKYILNKGEIKIRAGVFTDDKVKIEIKDTGQGILPQKLEKINALKDLSIEKINRSKGVGLGILLCQTLIKKNKGSINFESELNKGTKITILLPKAVG
ncbi:sensor histidine kinase [Tenacibaculum sp. C7A-26P2]|uniref:sensor histidine kinase n=1 Tax=Tenacibaculum sp. C7A-26P2 TaxID=3447504 RepID=UPI003F863305